MEKRVISRLLGTPEEYIIIICSRPNQNLAHFNILTWTGYFDLVGILTSQGYRHSLLFNTN